MQSKLNALMKLKKSLSKRTPDEVGEYMNAFKDVGDPLSSSAEQYLNNNSPSFDGFDADSEDDTPPKKKKVKK